MKVQRFLELSPQDRWPLGLRRSRHPPKDPPPYPPSRQLNLTSRPHTETLKGHTYVGLPQNTSNLNAVSNGRHLKISIGPELGEKAGIGREYAAPHSFIA